MSNKKNFTISRNEQSINNDSNEIDSFVSGQEIETTKTFRLPIRLSKSLKIHAAKIGQTEKDILVRLISDYLETNKA